MQIWKGNYYLTGNWLGRNKMWWTIDNHNYICHVCAKGFLDSNFNWAVIDKMWCDQAKWVWSRKKIQFYFLAFTICVLFKL